MTPGQSFVASLFVAGVVLMATARWSGNVILLPDWRFPVGLALLVVAVGVSIGLML